MRAARRAGDQRPRPGGRLTRAPHLYPRPTVVEVPAPPPPYGPLDEEGLALTNPRGGAAPPSAPTSPIRPAPAPRPRRAPERTRDRPSWPTPWRWPLRWRWRWTWRWTWRWRWYRWWYRRWCRRKRRRWHSRPRDSTRGNRGPSTPGSRWHGGGADYPTRARSRRRTGGSGT